MDLQLVITLKGGEISVSGPIDNKLVCYGLLSLAQEQIQAYHREKAASLVKPVTPAAIAQFGRNGG